MRGFILGLIIGTVGINGIANILNVGLSVIQNSIQEVNTRIQKL